MAASGQPTGRPYASPSDLDGNAPRQQEFMTGVNRTGDIAGNSAINANSARWNSLTPRQVGLTSVLQTAMPSLNARSESDYQRLLPGGYELPSRNGSAADTYEKAIYMRLQGQDEI